MLPLFSFRDSIILEGNIIYNVIYGEKGSIWQELTYFHNFKKHDYLSITEIGAVGYNIYNNPDIYEAESLLLKCRLDPSFSEQITYE